VTNIDNFLAYCILEVIDSKSMILPTLTCVCVTVYWNDTLSHT